MLGTLEFLGSQILLTESWQRVLLKREECSKTLQHDTILCTYLSGQDKREMAWSSQTRGGDCTVFCMCRSITGRVFVPLSVLTAASMEKKHGDDEIGS